MIFGHHQVEGLDYNETFSPVTKMVIVRTFLVVAAVKNWDIHPMDVHNGFFTWRFGGKSIHENSARF